MVIFMGKIWNEQERKVLLADFTDSVMQKDNDGKNSFLKDSWRIKTYVKDDQKLLPTHLRDFPEPYQVAQYHCGGTWNDYNQTFIIQVAECNLRCFYCFVPEELREGTHGKYCTAEEIMEIFLNQHISNVLRVSGGEPFLAPEFLMDLAKKIHREYQKMDHRNMFLWIDTNLLGHDYDKVINELNLYRIPYGICGCFKGFDAKEFCINTGCNNLSLYNKQFQNAKILVDSVGLHGEIFFYIPELVFLIKDTMDQLLLTNMISLFMKRLQTEVHLYAPLRTTVLTIKNYEVNKNRMPQNRIETGVTRKIWFDLLQKYYLMDLLWLPQYQIPLKLQKNDENN
jgi:uncharacterized Fe-S cluster-containing radical SAM superfamily protein